MIHYSKKWETESHNNFCCYIFQIDTIIFIIHWIIRTYNPMKQYKIIIKTKRDHYENVAIE